MNVVGLYTIHADNWSYYYGIGVSLHRRRLLREMIAIALFVSVGTLKRILWVGGRWRAPLDEFVSNRKLAVLGLLCVGRIVPQC